MRKLLVLALVLGLVGVAAAADLGNQAPVKVPGTYPVNVPNPERQGGDTIASATIIAALPYNDAGTTAGYVDDYAGTCVYDNGAPDVVYRVTVPAGVTGLDISLCGSTYDSGLFVLDSSLVQIACNDDYCGLQSQLDNVPVTAGQMYYIIVDGYSSASGSYTMSVEPHVPCIIACPTDGMAEGEPPLVPEYDDVYNGGCNADNQRFQHIQGAMNGSSIPTGTRILCGKSGWYSYAGSQYRDTDWFTLTANGTVEVTADAEYATYIFELSPQDCASVAVAQQATVGPCAEGFMTIPAAVHSTVWFWVGPTVFASPDGTTEYDYVVWFSGLSPEVVATEATTWGSLKALYE